MTTQDGQVKWKIKDMRTHHMCGEIVALVTTPPDYEHLLLCNGQTINADDYPELVAALGSNVLPNLNGRVLQGGEVAGQYKEAGLPNITGAFAKGTINDQGTANGWAQTDSIGAFKARNVRRRYTFASSENAYDVGNGFNFNASWSNPIYGASDTVQPPAYTVRYYICYG